MANPDARRPLRHPSGGPSRHLSRPERRRAARTRRNRLVLGASVVLSVVILVAWFPGSDLLHQRQQLAAASTELDRIRAANQALREQEKELASPSTIAHVAEQQYGLVLPGEEAYQVLPPSGSSATAGSTAHGQRSSGPSAPSGQATGGTSARSSSGSSVAGSGSTPGFFGRVLQTLEFWR